jgi:hypothetical protein
MFEPKKVTKTLTVVLSEHDTAQMGIQLAGLVKSHRRIEEEKRTALADFNAQLKASSEKLHRLQEALEKNTEERDVECELRLDADGTRVLTVRLDTGATVDVRPLSDEERQGELIFDSETPFMRDNQTLTDVLAVVGVEVSLEKIESLKDEQYREVERWAALSNMAQTDPNVEVPQRPAALSAILEPFSPERRQALIDRLVGSGEEYAQATDVGANAVEGWTDEQCYIAEGYVATQEASQSPDWNGTSPVRPPFFPPAPEGEVDLKSADTPAVGGEANAAVDSTTESKVSEELTAADTTTTVVPPVVDAPGATA